MIKHIDMSDSVNLDEAREILNALADKTRQEILMLFSRKPEACVTDIAKHFKLSRPTISHHLNLMKRVKILDSRKEGKEIFYSFNKQYVTDILNSLIKFLRGCC
jgi:ArsR family transcriptional regulator, arsenate/arsenite/antimonite-responsive transcriptional repressor